jgi:fumarate hydratase class II
MSAAKNLRPVDVRKDTDILGEVAVPSTALWGAQTQRSFGRNVEKLGVIRLGVGLILVMTFVAIMALLSMDARRLP